MELVNDLRRGLQWRGRALMQRSMHLAVSVGRRMRAGLAEHGISLRDTDAKLASLRDAHRGQRCFIIGNGPSLTTDDLDLISEEVTFASNKIYLAFERTRFRPTCYAVIDPLVLDNCCGELPKLESIKFIPHRFMSKVVPGTDAIWVDCLGEGIPGFSPDPLRCPLYGGHTVIYFQLQLAYYMGFTRMYLIGMDHTWQIPAGAGSNEQGYVVLTGEGEVNHFCAGYRAPGEKWTLPKPRLQEDAYAIANQYCAERGRQILNATRGGHLESFPRADLDRVMGNAEAGR